MANGAARVATCAMRCRLDQCPRLGPCPDDSVSTLDSLARHLLTRWRTTCTTCMTFLRKSVRIGRIRVGRPRAAPSILAEALPVQHSRLPTDPGETSGV